MGNNRHYPSGYEKTEYPDINAEIAMKDLVVMGFRGKRSKPDFHLEFRTHERRDKYIQDFLTGVESSLMARTERKEKNRKEKQEFLNQLIPGTILYSSWGYDQTNVNFYQVIKINGQKITMCEICKISVEGSEGFMSDKVVAAKNSFMVNNDDNAKEFTRMAQAGYVKMHDSANAYLWDGRPLYRSWYA